MHLARTETLTHLATHPKRGCAAFDEIGIINRFTGILVRDGFLPYQRYEQCRHSLCNAHLLRNLIFVSENEPAHKNRTIRLIELLVRIKDAVSAARSQAKSHLEESLQTDLLNRYNVFMGKAERAVRGSPKRKDLQLCSHNLYRRCLHHKKEILRFMMDFRIPFDNNGAERDLRMLKLQQKISGCFRSIEGAATFCRIRSFLSSVRKQARGVLGALKLVLEGQPII